MEVWFIILVSLCAYFSLKSLSSLLFSSYTSKKNESKSKLPPGPRPLPFIGNLLLVPKSVVDFRSVLLNLSHKYGPIITLYFGSKPVIFITSYSVAHQALVRNSVTFANRPPIVAVSSVLSNKHKDIGGSPYGQTWRTLRRNFISEVVHPTRVRSYAPERKRALEIMIETFSQSSKKKEPVVVLDHIRHAVYYLFINMSFGELSDSALRAVEDVQHKLLVNYKHYSVFGTWPRLGKFLYRNRWKSYMNLLRTQYDLLFPLIRARKKLKQEKGEELDLQVAYIDTLFDLQIPGEEGPLDESDILSVCGELVNAGADTTITTLQWIMSYIVKYPHVQTKLLSEITEIVGKDAEEVKEEDLNKAKYLKAVVLECLRIHPLSTSLGPHTVMEDVELCGYTIPKATMVNVVTSLIGRDPNVWKDPMEFKPERLYTSDEIGEEVSEVTAYKMMPFGAGRRICAGNKFGLFLLEYFVANLVWRFEWKAVDGEDVDLSEKEQFLVVMKNPVRAHVSPRIKK